uniref:WD_REPEATS_REGION domain-containing protein n=1 Tax=Caenorhabditis japonica TaxID=281687 RepID=A0A8R1DZH2_CAEJA
MRSSSNGLVAVWNIAPVLESSKCVEKNVPKLLFQIQSQTTANTCRWAPDGRRFAFGSDDSSVSVWEYVGRINSAGSVGNITSAAGNVERYKESCILRGHSMEVLAVEWSPNGKYLATSSIDHKILIYNAKKLPECITLLSGSESAVKGLAWDPIGKYLASLEGDKKLKLWTTDNWQCVTTIDEPFEDSKEESMFSRLDWSPDGKYLLTPAAVKSGQPLIKLIQRQTWKANHHLAGHRKGTTCVRSLPRMINAELKNGKRIQLTCAAVGSRDKSVSIWLFPGTVKPVLVVDNLFHHSVMDFAWCGTSLLACSQDGSVKVLTVDKQLLGEVLDDARMSDLCHQMYSIRPPQYDRHNSEDSNRGNPILGVETSAKNASFFTCPEEVIENRKQNESAKEKSIVPIESHGDRPKENELKEKEQKMIAERSKQTEERKNGKRRIQPIFLASTALGAESSASTSLTHHCAATSSTSRKPISVSPPRKRLALSDDEVDLEMSSDSEGEDEADTNDDDESSDEERSRTRKATNAHQILEIELRKPVLCPVEPKSLKTTEGTVLMEAPEQQSSITYLIPDRKSLVVEVDNRWKHGGIETCHVKLLKKRMNETDVDEDRRPVHDILWMTVVGAPVIIVSANKWVSQVFAV